jgi:hypothetical protein
MRGRNLVFPQRPRIKVKRENMRAHQKPDERILFFLITGDAPQTLYNQLHEMIYTSPHLRLVVKNVRLREIDWSARIS